MTEYLEDIPGSEHLAIENGDRFNGWYLTKKVLRKQLFSLNYSGGTTSYTFTVCDYNYKFIMPPKIEFKDGLITYSVDERTFGIFRFPRDENGAFCSPLKIDIDSNYLELSEDKIKELMKRQSPLTFKAYKIPSFGFEYLVITDKDIEAIRLQAEEELASSIQTIYKNELRDKVDEVKNKITALPNYLLILDSVLNLRWTNLQEVSFATDGIIHA